MSEKELKYLRIIIYIKDSSFLFTIILFLIIYLVAEMNYKAINNIIRIFLIISMLLHLIFTIIYLLKKSDIDYWVGPNIIAIKKRKKL